MLVYHCLALPVQDPSVFKMDSIETVMELGGHVCGDRFTFAFPFLCREGGIGIFSELHENGKSLAALSDISRGYNLQIKLSNWKRDCSVVQ